MMDANTNRKEIMIYLLNKNTGNRLSANFHSNEFTCHCTCGICLVDTELVIVCERVRSLAGEPVSIVRGYSCPQHNAKIGGAELSRHMMGTAADFYWKGMAEKLADKGFRQQIRDLKYTTQLMGIGFGKNKLHLDTDRSRIHLTEWEYK